MRIHFPGKAFFSRQTVERKSLFLGLILALPSLFLILGTALINTRLGTLVNQTLQSNLENELLLETISKLDTIQVYQSRLIRLATEAATARFEPYSDEVLYPQIRAFAGEQQKVMNEVAAYFQDSTQGNTLIQELSTQLRGEIRSFLTNLEEGLKSSLSEYTKISASFSEKFQNMQSLVSFYNAELDDISRTIEGTLGEQHPRMNNAYLLRLSRARFTNAIQSVLLDRKRPYIDEKIQLIFATEKKEIAKQIAILSPHAPKALQEYAETTARLEALEETEITALLRDWSKETGEAELRILKQNKTLMDQGEAILGKASYMAGIIQEQLRASDVLRSETITELRNWSGSFLAAAAAIAVLSLGFYSLFFRLFHTSLVNPLLSAARFAEEIQKGAHPAGLPEDREDEFGVLARALNRMDEEIQKKTQLLEQYNKNLEDKVEARTKHLEDTLKEISALQEELVFKGKLATLGQISANMAHELNTPLGAILSADRSMQTFFSAGFVEVMQKISTLEPEELKWFLDFLERLSTYQHIPVSDGWARKKILVQQFTDLGAAAPREWADIACDTGMENPSFFWPPPLREELALELFQILANILAQKKMISIIGDAAAKASYTVSTLKAYLQGSSENENTEFDLSGDIKTVLDLFHGKITKSIELVLDLEEDLRINGNRQNLSQVWSNLITNALQAMNYAGILTVSAQRKGDRVKVTVRDSGPGIPPDVLPRIFDPFFTTKKNGEGLGLGLDICKTIISRHGGTIEAESRPGNTAFIVTLPIAAQIAE